MRLLATLSESMTWTQKQLVGFVVVGLLIFLAGVQAWKRGNKLAVIACAVVVAYLGRGIGHGGPS